LILGETEKAHVRMGLYTGDAGSYVSLYDKAGKLRASVTADPEIMPISLYDEQDQPIFTVGNLGAPTEPHLVLGASAKARVQFGILQGGSGTFASLYDDGGTERAYVSATAKATVLSLNDANMTADLGSDPKGTHAGLFLSNGDLNYASIRFRKD